MTILTPRAGRTPCACDDDTPTKAGAATTMRRDSRTMALPFILGPLTRQGACLFPSSGLVTDDADLVAVGIPEISAVVVGMIVRAQPWRTFILAAGRHAGLVGRVDRGPVVRIEAVGHAVADRCCLLVERCDDPQLWPSAGSTVAGRLGVVGETFAPERLADAVIERLGFGDIVAADRDVAEHSALPRFACGQAFRMPQARRPRQAGATPAGRKVRFSPAVKRACRSPPRGPRPAPRSGRRRAPRTGGGR